MTEDINANRGFKLGLEFVLKHEGGYSFDPKDPGGETKYGISKRAYPALDIKNLTPEQAITIYYNDYWKPIGCDGFAVDVGIVAFDAGVNCGVARSRGWVRISPTDSKALIDLRQSYYVNLIKQKPELKKFEKGWWNRLADLRKLVDVITSPD